MLITSRAAEGYSMRLTPDQAQVIRQRIHTHMGQHVRIWLFGLSVGDSRRGGDVDLYVEVETTPDLIARRRCKRELADAMDLNVDRILQQPDQDLPIYRIAKRSGVPLFSPSRSPRPL